MSDNFLSNAIRERKKFWDPDRQSKEYHEDWANKERTYITRNISFFISYALRDAPITPNQITVLWVLMGVAGALFLACPHYGVSLLGLCLLYTSWVLDNVDGELARYNKEFSDIGNFTDMVGHQVLLPLTFASLTFLMYQREEGAALLVLGLLATALVTPLFKMQENVDLLRAIDTLAREKEYLIPEGEEVDVPVKREAETPGNTLGGFLKKVAGFLFTHCAMLYLLIGAVVFEVPEWFLVFYGVGIPLLFIPKYQARKKELIRALSSTSSFKEEMPPEWLDRNNSPE